MKKLAATLVPAIVACLAAPATGLAGLPNPDDPTIKVARVLGDVKTGMKIDEADKAWGSNGKCTGGGGTSSCMYSKRKAPEKGSAALYAYEKNEVFEASIDAYYNNKSDRWVFKGPLLDFKTPEGIGLGDPKKKVKNAYPRAEKINGGYGWRIEGKGKGLMMFGSADRKRITGISIVAGPQG